MSADDNVDVTDTSDFMSGLATMSTDLDDTKTEGDTDVSVVDRDITEPDADLVRTEDEPDQPAVQVVDDEPAQAAKKDDDDDDGLSEIVFLEDGTVEGDEPAETDAEDFEDPNTSVEKRVQRERRLKTESRQALDQEIQAGDQMYDRLTNVEKNYLNFKRDAYNMSTQVFSQYEASLQENIRMAKEAGDEEATSRFESQLLDVRDAKRTSEAERDKIPDADTVSRHQPNIQRTGRRPVGDAKTSDWIDNNSWFNDPAHSAKRAAAVAIETSIRNEGKLDPKSDEYWIEVSRRVSKEIQGVDVYTHDGRRARQKSGTPATGGRKRGGRGKQDIVGGGRAAPRARAPKKGQVTLTKGERQFLEQGFGLDMSDPKTQKEFASNYTGR